MSIFFRSWSGCSARSILRDCSVTPAPCLAPAVPAQIGIVFKLPSPPGFLRTSPGPTLARFFLFFFRPFLNLRRFGSSRNSAKAPASARGAVLWDFLDCLCHVFAGISDTRSMPWLTGKSEVAPECAVPGKAVKGLHMTVLTPVWSCPRPSHERAVSSRPRSRTCLCTPSHMSTSQPRSILNSFK